MNYNLTEKSVLLSVLSKYGIGLNKSAGQHFLICQEVVEAIILALDKETKLITELGAGVGTLTGALLAAGYQVRAIERDQRVAAALQKITPRARRENLQLIVNDLKDESWEHSEPYQLVGNIPYSLSGLIVKRVTRLDPAPTRVVLLVQKEVGERIVTGVPALSLIGLAVQLWGKAELLLNVPADCFYPPPKVDSQLIILSPGKQSLTMVERERVLKLAKIFFQQKRKQVGGVAERNLSLEKAATANLLSEADIAGGLRPQEITPDQWVTFSRAWYNTK